MLAAKDSLDSIRLLRHLPAQERAALVRECTFTRVAKGDTVFVQGLTDQRGVAFVISGRLSVRGNAEDGREVIYALVGPGDHTGELSALDPSAPRSATVGADTESVIAFMPSAAFRRMAFGNPQISQAVTDSLVAIIRRSSERIIEFATTSAPQRVCREILRLASTVPGSEAAASVEIRDMPDQTWLASSTGLSRESVCRAFKKIQDAGIVKRARNDVLVVNNMAALREMAQAA